MKITAVRAAWLRAPIPPERQHRSDFGVNDSFNTCLVEIDTDAGLTGLGEAKVGVGNLGNYAAVVALIHAELAPLLIGRDPRDITALWEALYNGTRAHYVARARADLPHRRAARHHDLGAVRHRHRAVGPAGPSRSASRCGGCSAAASASGSPPTPRAAGRRWAASASSCGSTSSAATAR